MIDAGLYALLAGNSGITALVGTRIFAGAAPDDLAQYPCISYAFVGGSSEGTMQTSGMKHQRIEVNGFAALPVASNSAGTVAANIRAAVIAAVEGWQQLLGDGTNVGNAELVNPGTDFVSEQRIFRAMCEFRVHYTLPS